MVRFIVMVREPGRLKPDYSLEFVASELPREGDYLSVQRPDHERPFGEDMIVAKVWWRLSHPETGPVALDPQMAGSVDEIFVECVPAIGPWSSDRWRDSLERAGAPSLEVSRLSVRESEIEAARQAVDEAREERARAAADRQKEPEAGSDAGPAGGSKAGRRRREAASQ
ncbi:MAG: hypothetical protein ACJ8ER_05550 [Allosphingosinicella sp.]